MNAESGFTIFFEVFAVFCIGAGVFYWVSGAQAKRRWHPRIVFGGALMFLAFVVTCFPATALIGAIPATALVVFLILKSNPGCCPSCGQRVPRDYLWVSLNYCSRCGTRLQKHSEYGPDGPAAP